MSRHPHIVNANDLPWSENRHGERFAAQGKRLGLKAGGVRLGGSLYRVAPGKTAFPHHRHYLNEEAIYVLSGTGTLRLDDAEHAVGPGDYIALPAGGPAHQLIATGERDLEYLCVSTMRGGEVVEYPDSRKLGAIVSGAGSNDPAQRRVFEFYRRDSAVPYYEGE
jgi:uncharacterized cupin superfamily protein